VAVVFGSDTAVNTEFLRAAEAVAPSLGVQVTPVDVSPAKGRDSVTTGINDAIATFANQPNGGLIVMPHIYTAANRGSIIPWRRGIVSPPSIHSHTSRWRAG
jgi:ABC-type branched-subunit amino acid transport system substrate-binding protein